MNLVGSSGGTSHGETAPGQSKNVPDSSAILASVFLCVEAFCSDRTQGCDCMQKVSVRV